MIDINIICQTTGEELHQGDTIKVEGKSDYSFFITDIAPLLMLNPQDFTRVDVLNVSLMESSHKRGLFLRFSSTNKNHKLRRCRMLLIEKYGKKHKR